jgi:hypothetical protein
MDRRIKANPPGDVAGFCQHFKFFAGQVGALRYWDQTTWFTM